jgi:DNA-binding NarL/FixJ family response regulator
MRTRIVVVDDDAPFRESLAAFLVAVGLDVVCQASNGAEAVDAVRAMQPDLVVMDIHIRGTDGIAGARLLKAEWPDLPVIILSGLTESTDRAAALAVGAADVLSEAILPAELQKSLAPHIARGCYTPVQQ